MGRKGAIRFNPDRMFRWRKPDREIIAFALLTAGEGLHSGSAFLPSYFTIRTLALQPTPDGPSVEQKLRNLRSGYVPAVGFALFMGTAVSILAEHPLPLVAAAGTSVLMVAAYESALPADVRFNLLPAGSPSLPPGTVIDVTPGTIWST
jgi:hypothetical protein